MRHRKWTEQQLREAVLSSRSVAQTLKALGLNPTGANYSTIHANVKRLGLTTTHWTGKGSNRGSAHSGGPAKLAPEIVLVLGRQWFKEPSTRVRRAMLESGVPLVCVECGQGPEWNGKPLVLPIDHLNGDNLDNRPWNVRFLCPNCHSQTSTFAGKNRGRNK